MFLLILLILTQMTNVDMVFFDFNKAADTDQWYILDDVVMGGRSNGKFKVNEAGHGTFYGAISLDNNGGFSSVRYRFDTKDISDYKQVKIRLKGDGKKYQFRLKKNRYERYAYIYSFQTTADWQTISIPLEDMKPSFRGYFLDLSNYTPGNLEEITFLIGNKKEEKFKLEIDKIYFTK